MREIKFRGMCANGEMHYGQLSQDIPNSTAYYNEYSQRICWNVGTARHNIPVSNKTLSQYTCLTDKNDVEIYEGDILHYKGYFHHIVSNWRNRGKSIKNEVDGNYPVKYEDNTGFQMYHQGLGYYKIHSVDVEVIGNIYENPGLLEE